MFASLLLAGCGSGGSAGSAKADSRCVTGDLRCECFGNNTCNTGLVCLSQICVNPDDIPGAGGATGSGGAGGSSSSSACETGNLRCSCYGNRTCNNNLVCASDICVDLPGTGGIIAGSGGVIACLQTTGCALQEPPWGNPSPSMGPTGNNYVMIQTSTMSYDDWGLGYIYPPPWDPTRIHSVQWKLPAQSLSVPYNFCVQKVGIIHN